MYGIAKKTLQDIAFEKGIEESYSSSITNVIRKLRRKGFSPEMSSGYVDDHKYPTEYAVRIKQAINSAWNEGAGSPFSTTEAFFSHFFSLHDVDLYSIIPERHPVSRSEMNLIFTSTKKRHIISIEKINHATYLAITIDGEFLICSYINKMKRNYPMKVILRLLFYVLAGLRDLTGISISRKIPRKGISPSLLDPYIADYRNLYAEPLTLVKMMMPTLLSTISSVMGVVLSASVSVEESEITGDGQTCPICLIPVLPTDKVLPCGHSMHDECFIAYSRTFREQTCPICRSSF